MARTSENRLHPLSDEGKIGKVFVLRNDLVSDEGRLAIAAAARAIFVGNRGSLAVQLERFANGVHAIRAPRHADVRLLWQLLIRKRLSSLTG